MRPTRAPWERVSVAEVCESIVDCVNKTAPTVDEPTPYKMIRTTNVKKGWVNLSEVKYVTKETFDRWTRRQLPRKGDVILTREAPLGEVGMLRGDDQVFLGQRLVSYRANPAKLDNRFLLYAFQGRDVQAQVKGLGSGATVEHMRVPDCEKLTLSLPPLSEQRGIASILSAYDDLIENNARRIAILEEMARRIYEEWFVRFRFPGHEQVKMVESELGLIPEGWRVKGVYDIADVTYGFPFKSKLFRTDGIGRGVIRIRDIRDNSPCASTEEVTDQKYLVVRGDIVIGMDGQFHMGKWAGPESWLNQRVLRLKPKEGVSRNFLFWAVRSPIQVLEKTIVGTTVAHLSAGDMKAMRLITPPDRLMEKAHEVLDPLLELELNLHYKNANLRATRDLLLPKLISGELDVSTLPEPEEAIAA